MKQNHWKSCSISQISTDKTIPLSIAGPQQPPQTLSSLTTTHKPRPPQIQLNTKLRQVLRKKNMGQINKESQLRLPPQTKALNSSKKNSKEIFKCQICLIGNKTVDLYISECQHKNHYCEQCLHEYAIYRIKQFQEVTCPDPSCDIPIETRSHFFQGLPIEIQQRYYKIRQFHLTHEDPNAKMCPLQSCEGVIRRERAEDATMMCDTCKSVVCSNCLMKKHSGDCEEYELNFLQQNLNYQKCRKCGVIIEKNQGCNHMTCRCKHQFCYVCGQDWAPNHHFPHDQSGKALSAESMKALIDKSQHTTQATKRDINKEPVWTDCMSQCSIFLWSGLMMILRALLFLPKIVVISLLGIFLFVYMILMILLGASCCCCLLAKKQCEDVFSKIEKGGACIANLIKSLWEL